MLEGRLYRDHFSTPEMRGLWAEAATLARWVEVKQAVADCQARMGLIPAEAAARLSEFKVEMLDRDRLAEDMALAGRPIVGLVKQLREHAGEELAPYVHLGATTQDIMDTAMVLQMKDGFALIDESLTRILDRLGRQIEAHGTAHFIGRTNGQYALPMSLGTKLRVWVEELKRRRSALEDAAARALFVQFGGPVGDLQAFDRETGPRLKHAVAQRLGLGLAEPHWQNARDGVAEAVASLGLLAASLCKIAHNVNALSSSDIGEMREAPANGKGASSSMAHKRNQRCSEFAEAVARLARQRAEQIGEVTLQEHERSGGVWIAEWVIVPESFLLISGALSWTERLFQGLEVDEARMKANLANAL